MTQTEAMQNLINRYDCEIYQALWGVHGYYKNITLIISFQEDIQKWGWGNLWIGSKMDWSTGEFARADKLTTEQLFSVLDSYFPLKKQTSLF